MLYALQWYAQAPFCSITSNPNNDGCHPENPIVSQYDSGSRIFKLKQYFCRKFRQTAPLDGLERDVAIDVIAPELLDGHGQTIAFL